MPSTPSDGSQLMVASATIVGTTPPVFDVWPLLGRWSSPPGPAAMTAVGASKAVPLTRAAASQPARRRVEACVMSWSPSAVDAEVCGVASPA